MSMSILRVRTPATKFILPERGICSAGKRNESVTDKCYNYLFNKERNESISVGNLKATTTTGGDGAEAKVAHNSEGNEIKATLGTKAGGDNWFGKLRAKAGKFNVGAFISYGDTFHHPRNLSSVLQRRSRYMKLMRVIVSEEEDGMNYFIPLAGTEPEKVDFKIRGVLMDVVAIGKDGTPQVVAELKLPQPDGEYKPGDFRTTWFHGEAKLVVTRYKDRFQTFTGATVKGE
ncbi:hypothetical protein L1987_00331 [Smallanthus sonchifolius]|uniref:Uncharacterized protein n=1 Tax=Smallanthus sonchifolius TaxID=185202 RepID=A0ACB9K255_9ASTR|nr:hypothetical protein L1987_00331 [Smallanthus sonchifolius]